MTWGKMSKFLGKETKSQIDGKNYYDLLYKVKLDVRKVTET